MYTLYINAYQKEPCTDIKKAIISIASNKDKTYYLIGSLDDLKNFDLLKHSNLNIYLHKWHRK